MRIRGSPSDSFNRLKPSGSRAGDRQRTVARRGSGTVFR
jgi:hypothetical protein